MTDRPLAPVTAATLGGLSTLQVPGYDRSALRAGIAHFGVGNFHRAHQAVYLDRYLAKGGSPAWGIVGIGIGDGAAARQKARRFAEQDCLYTLTELSPDGTSTARVIGAMVGYLHAPSEPERVLDLLSSPQLHIVTLSITEGGYFVDQASHEFAPDDPEVRADSARPQPRTVFGYIVRALERRRRAGLRPFTVVSCDNLPHNGDVARAAVVGYAGLVSQELAAWIAAHGAFPNSMVDRVVPYVDEEARKSLNERAGVDDRLAVMAETYLQWVLEDDFADGRPELEEVVVQMVRDVSAYETAKLRLLNAPHVLLAYPAVLAGHRVVHSAVAEPDLRALLETFMAADVLPQLDGMLPPDLVAQDYMRSILERFGNPSIEDQLLRIATDGASKIPTFHASLVRGMLSAGRDVRREALLLASYRRYLSGTDDKGQVFEVTEPYLAPDEQATLGSGDPIAILRHAKFAGLQVADDQRFVGAYRQACEILAGQGALAAVRAVLD